MPIFDTEHFAGLLCQARDGSSDALGKLLEPFRLQLLVNRQRPLPLGSIDCAELIQETFRAAVRAFPNFRGTSEGELFVWLRQIMKTQCLNLGQRRPNAQKRAVSRQVSLEQELLAGSLAEQLADDEPTPCTSNATRERNEIMYRALEQLKPRHQEVIQLHYMMGKSFAEIAGQLGKSPRAVIKSWNNALQEWRDAMEAMGLSDF